MVCRDWTEREWKANFRMPRGTFLRLCADLYPYVSRSNTQFREAVPVSKRVAVCFWRLAGNSEYRTVSHLFGIGCSTACTVTNQVCRAIVQHLLKQYIRLPCRNRLMAVIQKFEQQQGIPQVGGAIDGTHIPIKAPSDHPDEYYNRKSFHSVILQAVVDSFMYFTDICVGWPGRVHDARVLSKSALYHKAQHLGTCFPDGQPVNVNGVMVPVIIIGDPAYPLLPWLMKPFPETGAHDKRKFNFKLSSTRIVVERSFGLLLRDGSEFSINSRTLACKTFAMLSQLVASFTTTALHMVMREMMTGSVTMMVMIAMMTTTTMITITHKPTVKLMT